MRSLSLTLLAVAALLTPAVAMAASPAAPPAATARYFEIRGLALGDRKIAVHGKIAVEGSKLMASAGCNMIGGEVSVDGDNVTIVGPTFMTEMACPGTNGDAEALLIKILALGTFRITDGGWLADGGEIITVEIPASIPGPVGSPPDEPITSGPIATIVDPAPGGPTQTCPPIPADYGTNPIDSGPAGGPISGGGSGSSGSGSTGTGTVTPGTVTVEPNETSGSEPATTPDSEPAATPESEPVATANDLPLETGSVDPQPPAPPAPGETLPVVKTDPDPGFTGKDPNVGKPLVDPCYGATLGAGQVEADLQAAPKAAAFDNSAARDAAVASPGLVLPMAFGLVVLVLAGAATDRRRRVGQ
ncbi:MAG TPA: META domain-containing protein [Candidatus Limnocylindrales bacterium]|nr:META domain-containing protein [Candidatus Limnocylindrales bacterium]